MPEIYHHTIDRRSCLKIGTLAGLGLLVGMPAGAADEKPAELRLALLSDTHIAADRTDSQRGMNPWENLHTIMPAVIAAGADGLILNGDAARKDGQVADYQALKPLLAPAAAAAPVYIGMGNHDDRDNFHKVFAAEAGKSALQAKCVLVIEHPLLRVIMLDSLLYVNRVAGLLGKEQRKWLKDYLAQHTDRPIVVFVHHTLGEGDGDLLDAGRMFAVLEPHSQVKAVFYGHSHVWNFSRRNKLHLVNLPAVGYNFSDREPIGWVDARFDATGASLTLHACGRNREGDGKTTRIDWA